MGSDQSKPDARPSTAHNRSRKARPANTRHTILSGDAPTTSGAGRGGQGAQAQSSGGGQSNMTPEEFRRKSMNPNFYGNILASGGGLPGGANVPNSHQRKASAGYALSPSEYGADTMSTGGNSSTFTTGDSGTDATSRAGAAVRGNFRSVVKQAVELAAEQRDRYGKFRKDEKRAVMELYEILGLEEDTFLQPPNELQKRIAAYQFPPPDMHMLRDRDVIDEDTLEYVLGPDEAMRRRMEGMEVAPAPRRQENDAKGRRVGVSSEATNALMRSHAAFKSIPKTREQGVKLMAAIKRCVLFTGLDSSDINILFQAFQQEYFPADNIIFEQGEEGDRFYLIETGRVRISVVDPKTRQEVVSLFEGEGDTFGELAIMYGTRRAATITTVVDTMLWWIDRDTYRSTLMKATLNKREKYIKFLESVPLFQSVDSYEKARIADVLEVQDVHGKGTYIIREGEQGDTFYLIEEGEVAFETSKSDKTSRGRPGDFFGEMALIFNRPRAASVYTVSSVVRLLTLNRANFTNYLGPFEEILRRNAEQYKGMVLRAHEMAQQQH